MFCGNCGNQVQANERFCGSCGAVAQAGAPAAPPPPAAPAPPPPAYGAPPPQHAYAPPPPAYGAPPPGYPAHPAPPYGHPPMQHGMPPMGGMPGGPVPDVPNYMWQSIAVTLCCCLIGGAFAWSNAAKVKPALARGDYAGAMAASAKAKKWIIWSVILGAILNGIVIAAQVAQQQGGF